MADTKNELQAFANTADSFSNIDAALKQDAEAGKFSRSSGGRKPILKLGQQDGEWYAGIEAIHIQHHEHLILNAATLRHGYVSWVNRQKTGETMVAYGEPKPAVQPGGEHAWQEQVGFDLAMADDPTFEMSYDQTSKGGKTLFNDLLKEIAGRPSHSHHHPIFTLSSTSSTKGGYSTRYPKYEMVGWMSDAGERIDHAAPAAIEQMSEANDNAPTSEEQKPQRRTRAA